MTRPLQDHIDVYCRPGSGPETCRYFSMDCNGARCLKRHADAKIVLDFRVSNGTMKARGDNCEGIGT